MEMDPSAEFDCGIEKQPIFIDLIIKIILCRVYVNVRDRKLLTAEKILGNAEHLLRHVEIGRQL